MLTTSFNKSNFGTIIFYSLKKQRFDFIFIRFIKKLCRRKYCKVKMRFFKPKFLLNLQVNYVCSMKSKNARMGAGVGKIVRLVMQLKKGNNIINFKYYSLYQAKKILNYLKFKCNIGLILKLIYI